MDFEIYELVEHLAKKAGYCEGEISEEDLEEFVEDRYGVSSETFSKIINDLLPLCDKAESPLTGTLYQGFGTEHVWLLNRKC